MHSGDIFSELSLILVLVAIIAGIVSFLRQPLILGYIITGILVGPLALDLIHAKEAFEGFSQIGIALLLFIIGLGMNVGVVRSLGKVSVVTAGILLLVVGGIGLGICSWLGYGLISSLILGVALFFSSTILILKVLSDKREVNRLHGQIAIGVILIDDIIATLAIVAVAAIATSGGFALGDYGYLAAKAAGLGIGLYLTGRYLIPPIAKSFAKNQELLFLFAIAWGFGIASLFAIAGFSHEVGALFAGVSLASVTLRN